MMNAQTMMELLRDYLQNKYGTAAVQISSDGIERIYYNGIPLNDLAAALAGKPGAAHDQLSRLRQAILDHTQGDGFWIGEILLAVLAKETGFNGSLTRPEGGRLTFCERCNANRVHLRAKIIDGVQTFECPVCAVARPERSTLGDRSVGDTLTGYQPPRPDSATDVRLTHSTADGSIHSGFSDDCQWCNPSALARPDSNGTEKTDGGAA